VNWGEFTLKYQRWRRLVNKSVEGGKMMLERIAKKEATD
jgi:hypothetical protein